MEIPVPDVTIVGNLLTLGCALKIETRKRSRLSMLIGLCLMIHIPPVP